MKAWIKGGLIGGLAGAFLWLLSLTIELFSSFSSLVFFHNLTIRNLIMFLGSPLCYLGEGRGYCWLYIGHILNIILFFVAGVLVAWIIGKIKAK